MKKTFFILLCGFGLFMGGCLKKTEVAVQAPADTAEKRVQLIAAIFTAVNKHEYESAQRLIHDFIEAYPSDAEVSSMKLMMADVAYEQEHFAESYEAYRHFLEYFPAHQRAEYALYKAAHAKFNQANHVTCDSTPVEEALGICREYMAHKEYVQYRGQVEDLARTCERNLLDKELYVVNSYLNQQRYASARNRLAYVAQKFDLSQSGKDHYYFCCAKLARAENDDASLARFVDDLHGEFPRSQFTAMADRLAGKRGLLFG